MTDDDIDEFHKAMRGVKPLKPSGKLSPTKSPPTIKLKRVAPVQEPVHHALTDAIPHPVGPEDTLSYVQSGLNPQVWKDLRLGKLATHASLDLHGLTVDQARDALSEFIDESYRDGARVLSLVHGKSSRGSSSYPVLKNLVATWLKQFPQVLAFHSAIPKNGGKGALYILLKRPPAA